MDIQNQIDLEMLYSKNQTMPRLRAWFDSGGPASALQDQCPVKSGHMPAAPTAVALRAGGYA